MLLLQTHIGQLLTKRESHAETEILERTKKDSRSVMP